ncbi:MAG TPA: response regulator transcription factor [Blastocatellia bacterium]|nr:response regulator transcription factor [Blastocatellia bacterium]
MTSTSPMAIRIMIVDDHAILRAGLRMLIEAQSGMVVAGEAGNRTEAIAVASREQPDIILLDLDLGGTNSLDFVRDLAATAPEARLIVLTGVRDQEQHRRAVHLGAMGLVLKDRAADMLIKAIDRVHAGEVWLDRSMMATVLAEMTVLSEEKRLAPESAKIAQLTVREREIIKYVCQGLKNKQIAEQLFISEATVRNHITSILAKLELTDRFDLALFSYRHGLGQLPQ